MCLYVSEFETAQLLRRFKDSIRKDGGIRAWKVYEVNTVSGELISSYQRTKVRRCNDYVVSDRKYVTKSTHELRSGEISKGIHVYLFEPSPYHLVKDVVVPVYVYKDDLVSGGNNLEAVFMRVKIEDKDWNDAQDRVKLDCAKAAQRRAAAARYYESRGL